jgi:hypothetical protein
MAPDRPRWIDRVRHAFGVEAPGPVPPDPEDRERIEELLGRIVSRDMVTPAVLLLESWRPLNGVTAQAMHALAPFVGLLGDASTWDRLARYMQRRGSIPWMLDRLEAMQAERGDRA